MHELAIQELTAIRDKSEKLSKMSATSRAAIYVETDKIKQIDRAIKVLTEYQTGEL